MLTIGITQGDINGIGYEVIVKTLEDNRLLEICTPVVYGSAKLFNRAAKEFASVQIPLNVISDASDAKEGIVNLINVIGEGIGAEPGTASAEAGAAALEALQAATADALEGKIDALVTAPVNKSTIHSDEFPFAGHTEYLASMAGGTPLMILFNANIRIALLTTHLPISEVAAAVTSDAIVEKLRLMEHSLIKDFGIVKPRIAVLSLNPHAGDSGVIGTEEQTAIIPAIEKATAEKIHCYGPYAADGFFGAGLYKNFDGVLAMYHDQGLAPFKSLAMDSGVNFTAGLSIVRTSPDHGTGFDIAGQGVASEASMREAIYAAIDIARNRALHEERTANPLRRQYFDKSKDNVVLDLSGGN